MREGTEYLNVVTEKLKKRLQEVEKSILSVQQDIQDMNDYYWENYAEMDEYGYENYDNQQALKHQVKANQENRLMRRRLLKMLDAPFFGRVSFLYDGDTEPEQFYIGIGNFSDTKGGVPWIYDWRAPVSSLFYDYDNGPASYEAPGGSFTGNVTGKAQYKIRRGRMIYEVESDFKIDDEILKEELSRHADIKLKNIIRTIQKEQNAIIRNTKDRVLIIQGAAGSGKTSIALHRIAYLLYHDRQNLKSSNVLILSPSSVFSDYISHILPELGEENIQEMSLDVFAYRELRHIVNDCKDRYDNLEAQIAKEKAVLSHKRKRQSYEKEAGRFRYKQSKAFVEDCEAFLLGLEDRIVELREFSYKKMTMPEEEIRRLFYEKHADVPLLLRLEEIYERFLDEYETLYGELADQERDGIKEAFCGMYVTKDILVVYNWFLKEYNLPRLRISGPEEMTLDYEDVYPVLYLKYRLSGAAKHRQVRHLVIDEMQDYSYLQYCILELLFPCSKTILGDKAQTIDGSMQDVLSFLPRITGRDSRRIVLKKSYRNTAEISEYANRIGGLTDAEYYLRHGMPVEEISADTCEEMAEDILKRLSKVSRHEERPEEEDAMFETTAVLTMTEAEAQEMFACLKNRGADVNYVDKNSTGFPRGMIVTPYYLAKGLEFDQVFVCAADERLTLYRQYHYICATRALHELYVYTQKERDNSRVIHK